MEPKPEPEPVPAASGKPPPLWGASDSDDEDDKPAPPPEHSVPAHRVARARQVDSKAVPAAAMAADARSWSVDELQQWVLNASGL
eukprot:COSAG06_NODE_56743_length_283_cov_0.847826_1_plen_84_part_10